MPPVPASAATGKPEAPIAIKVTYNGEHRRFRLSLGDLGAYTFPYKVRNFLGIKPESNMILERYSDSAGDYVVLDSKNHSVYKQLFRAAKAKLKLRILVTVADATPASPAYDDGYDHTTIAEKMATHLDSEEGLNRRTSYLDTVLQQPVMPPSDHSTIMDQINKSPVAQDDNPFRSFELASKPKETLQRAGLFPFSKVIYIDCNACGASIPNEHYHCSICEGGDYDLCQQCVDSGVYCPGDDHWLIKRSVDGGTVINSTSEILPPKITRPSADPEVAEIKDEPIIEFKEDPMVEEQRICNSCVRDFPETEMVTCNSCSDYDLCYGCLISSSHGHNPAHSLSPMSEDDHVVWDIALIKEMSKPGRIQSHSAICDNCDKNIIGVRHKCLDCPDWDFCNNCVADAPQVHPGHRFVPVYGYIPVQRVRAETHSGVFCDGALCSNRMGRCYISGVRYKCAVCDDLDLCASCEAHPDNTHNRTHPLLKFKTPVRHASISTYGVDDNGETLAKMGDRAVAKSTLAETISPSNSNASTQVHAETPTSEPAIDTPDIVSEEKKEKPMAASTELGASEELNAEFLRDTIPDGTALPPNMEFTQIWTLHNSGPATWPKGCSVRFVGGDGMFNVDITHPMSVDSLVGAMETHEIDAPVLPGSAVDFAITLKSPQRLGKAISYWRLKSPENVPFGDRLWCDIDVQGNIPKPEPQVNEDKSEVEESVKNEAKASPDAGSETKPKESLTDSDMVFPKLEKESAVNSEHESTESQTRNPGRNEYEFIAEDLESLTVGVESDDGFLTDEEYDVLDASDQEIVDESGNPSQKK